MLFALTVIVSVVGFPVLTWIGSRKGKVRRYGNPVLRVLVIIALCCSVMPLLVMSLSIDRDDNFAYPTPYVVIVIWMLISIFLFFDQRRYLAMTKCKIASNLQHHCCSVIASIHCSCLVASVLWFRKNYICSFVRGTICHLFRHSFLILAERFEQALRYGQDSKTRQDDE